MTCDPEVVTLLVKAAVAAVGFICFAWVAVTALKAAGS